MQTFPQYKNYVYKIIHKSQMNQLNIYLLDIYISMV